MDLKTQEQRDDQLVSAIAVRQGIIDDHATNIDNFTQQLSHEDFQGLPDVWPAELLKYARIGPEKLAAAWVQGLITEEQYDTIRKMADRDRLRHFIKTEEAEKARNERLLASLQLKVPDDYDRWAAAVTRSTTTPVVAYTAAQKAAVLAALNDAAYDGMTTAQKVAALNAKTQRGRVPLTEVESAAPLELARIRHAAERAKLTDTPNDLQVVCLAAADWFSSTKHESIDFDLPHVRTALGILVALEMFTQARCDEIIALGENRQSLCEANEWPTISESLLASFEAS